MPCRFSGSKLLCTVLLTCVGITPTILGGGTWRWSIDDGFHDCTDGCDCHRLYVIDIDLEGNVTLISYQEVGQTWCDFGSP